MLQKISAFIFLMIVWFIFAGKITIDVLIVGSAAALLVTIFFSDMLFREVRGRLPWYHYFKKLILLLLFIPVFFYEAITAALKVSKHVFEKDPSFNPGIVKVKTKLTDITGLTLLANLITLTPGTLTLDYDRGEKAYYIHWIDVETVEEAELKKKIIARFESWIGVIFR
ncbi:Na+/H+ antiporter subunit E [Halanaerobium praevalens]|uniref:Cation antiporter n=1 Tax=Halanaerobium praevalens (strain ATCC 33744 / DSM 2228 / GSL) TaxID=572479 RepID=E3DNT8_HALPG|nr:Na+/H+ antiporter subunit E [Halanaerobium praevalens]ADO76562.1 cation antiporter [Halanaerobium praevalens DSM 2228]